MKFHELFNQHIDEIECSSRELSAASGLSESVISRYKNGTREPAADSPQLDQLVRGLSQIAKGKGIENYDVEDLLTQYSHVLNAEGLRYQTFLNHFRTIVDEFHINMRVLSNALSYEVSFLYRVKSGERQPNDLDEFATAVASYIAENYSSTEDLKLLSKLLKINGTKLRTEELREKELVRYFFKADSDNSLPAMESFLKKMDEFNLDEYIEAIHFNDIKIPKVPFQLPTNKTYYGVVDMREAELDFFKTTVLSKSMAPIFMNSDMPMLEAAEDMDFNKKWMFAIAASLRKGLHINIIHFLDRPFEELMLGLEAWIPIYMTGLVSPYYLPDTNTKVFHNMLYTSGAAVLTGECIDGHYADGRLVLSNSKEEMNYYTKRSTHLLSKAKHLMKIYDATQEDEFQKFESSIQGISYTTPDENAFRNISIRVYDAAEPFVVITKQTHPSIHFVIYHPILVDALTNFVVAVKE